MLASWKKSYDQPRQHIKKQRCYFVDKGPSSQSSGFSISHVWIWELDHKEGWALKNWCFWTVLLENPEYSVEGLILKLSFQYFGHLVWTASSSEKTLMLGKTEAKREEGGKGWDGWMASPIQWTWTWMNSRRWWGTGRPGVQSMGSRRVVHDSGTEQHTAVLWRLFAISV